MKNKGLIITLIVLLSVIVVLLIAFLVLNISRNFSFAKGIFNFEYKSSEIIYEKKFELADIRNIEIKQDAGDIIFRETSDEEIKVVVYGDNEDSVNIDVNNNKLYINYKHKPRFFIFSFGITKDDIIVYLPSNYSDRIKVNNDLGNCIIADFENAILDIDTDAGNVEIEKAKDITVKCDLGNVTVGEVLNKCDIKVDCGNLEIDKLSIKEDSSMKVNLGNVDINKTENIYIDADVELGKADIENNDRNSNITLKIDCDCGNVKVGK